MFDIDVLLEKIDNLLKKYYPRSITLVCLLIFILGIYLIGIAQSNYTNFLDRIFNNFNIMFIFLGFIFIVKNWGYRRYSVKENLEEYNKNVCIILSILSFIFVTSIIVFGFVVFYNIYTNINKNIVYFLAILIMLYNELFYEHISIGYNIIKKSLFKHRK